MKTYQDTLCNQGDGTVHGSVGNIQVVGCKADLRIICTLITKLKGVKILIMN